MTKVGREGAVGRGELVAESDQGSNETERYWRHTP